MLTQRVDDLESTLANQTTDSDTRIRDEGIFHLKAALAQTQKDLTAAELERDLAIRERDDLQTEVTLQTKLNGETSERLQDLEVELGAKEAEVKVLSSQVESLRKEHTSVEGIFQEKITSAERSRDAAEARSKIFVADLAEQRRLLEYAEVEYRFTIQATEDHQARIREISQAKDAAVLELQQTTQALESAMKMKQEVLLIKDRLEQAQDRISVLEMALVESEDARKEIDTSQEDLKAALDAKQAEFAAVTSEKDALTDCLASAGQPVDELVAALQREKRDWEARVQRRNRQIVIEQDKIRRMEVNLALANRSLMEQEDSMNKLQGKLTAAEAAQQAAITISDTAAEALSATNSSLEASQQALSVASDDVASLSILVNTLVAEVIVSLGNKRAVTRDLAVARLKVKSTEEALIKATSAQDSLASQLGSSHLDIEQLRGEHNKLTGRMEEEAKSHLQETATWEAKLSASAEDVARVCSELAALTEEKEMLSRLQKETLSELASVNARVLELEVTIDAARSLGSSEAEALQTRLEQAETVRESAEAALAALQSAVDLKQEEASTLSAQLRETSDAHSSLQSAAIEAEKKIAVLIAEKDALATELETSQLSTTEASLALSQTQTKAEEAVAEKENLAEQLSRAQEAVQELSEHLSTLRMSHAEVLATTESEFSERLAGMEGKLAEVEEAKAVIGAQCEELERRGLEADSAIAAIKQSEAAAVSRLSEATAQATALQAELTRAESEVAGVREALQARTVELDQARQQAADASSRLDNSKMAIEQE